MSLDHVHDPLHDELDDEHELLHRSGVPHAHGPYEGETAHAHDNLILHTIGIDIGSTTSHLMFGEVHLRRLAQSFSSKYVVVDRQATWRSDVLLTPYTTDGLIDAAQLRRFVDDCYTEALVDEDSLDTGVVILTGDALARANSRAISAEFADDSGKFICALAGHHREAAMAASGSGSVQMSSDAAVTSLHVDVGGGTTKLAVIKDGAIESTCAVAVGARTLLLDDERCIVRLAESARLVAESAGLDIRVGEVLDAEQEQTIAEAMVAAVVRFATGQPWSAKDHALLLTEPLEIAAPPRFVTFSGGVSEFVYGREHRSFNDLGNTLGAQFRAAALAGVFGAPMSEPRQGIRATAVGLSQFSVQVSGKTVHAQLDLLPLRNVPVVGPVECGGAQQSVEIAGGIERAAQQIDLIRGAALAIAIRWRGDPGYRPLRALADALASFANDLLRAGVTVDALVVLLDSDLAAALGSILQGEIGIPFPILCFDSVDVDQCDFVDVGSAVGAAQLIPVIMKSMLFES